MLLPVCTTDCPPFYVESKMRYEEEDTQEGFFKRGSLPLYLSRGDLFIMKSEYDQDLIIEDKTQIQRFLNDNEPLLGDISGTIRKMKKFFINHKISLEIFEAPEDNDGESELFISVISNDTDRDVISFDELNEWFVENVYKNNERLNLNINIIFE